MLFRSTSETRKKKNQHKARAAEEYQTFLFFRQVARDKYKQDNLDAYHHSTESDQYIAELKHHVRRRAILASLHRVRQIKLVASATFSLINRNEEYTRIDDFILTRICSFL